MMRNWTFGQKLGAGYGVMIAFALLISLVAALALRSAVASKDRVIAVFGENLIDAQRLLTTSEQRVAAIRGFLLDRRDQHLDEVRQEQEEFRAVFARVRERAASDEERGHLAAIDKAAADYQGAIDRAAVLGRSSATAEAIARFFDTELSPRRLALLNALDTLVVLEQKLHEGARVSASDAAASAIAWLTAIAALGVACAVALAIVLARSLGRQIGTAVGHVQSSSTELQAAATQQASGAKQQAGAMSEISTTISELVATSRQIAESAQRVAQIAEQTAAAARHGEGTVEKGQESVSDIRRQVDVVVEHMLDLGKKSQEIGAVLDIVSELAEQTNILAINATIEATGAGEAGRRFAAVAEEIRKLADRVGNSTKEIRTLIDDVRGAVNTTVMATEGSAKAVDAGSRQFGEVAVAFKQIAGMVGATSDAAREIELSTKQQATAAEQVRTAVSDVAQATHESEASTDQTLRTASQLAGLSKELLRLIRPQAA